jgi:NADH:ubiquinone oxidoreductase subunit 5 (subunit L)/multisubunit Na+/H+ antiporter MnhA subunit
MGKTIFTCVYVGKYFKTLLLKNGFARKAEIYMKAIYHSTKIMVCRVSDGATIGKIVFTCVYIVKTLLKIFFSKTTGPEKLKFK